jgi:hypothetical protein
MRIDGLDWDDVIEFPRFRILPCHRFSKLALDMIFKRAQRTLQKFGRREAITGDAP